MERRKKIIPLLLVLVCLEACDEKTLSDGKPKVAPHKFMRHADPRKEELGRAVFQQNCARCHGELAQGAANWRQRGADGRYPPPPLNGTGHDWHHPAAVLRDVIHKGSPAGQGDMPAWGGKLSDEEIDAAIAWFQSLWSDDVYAAWSDIERRAQAK